MTGPGKTGLIYTKHMCLYYGTYLQFCVCYPNSVNFIEFLMDFCIYDDILDAIQIIEKKLLLFKLSKSNQILCVDKTCFPRLGHIFNYSIQCMYCSIPMKLYFKRFCWCISNIYSKPLWAKLWLLPYVSVYWARL